MTMRMLADGGRTPTAKTSSKPSGGGSGTVGPRTPVPSPVDTLLQHNADIRRAQQEAAARKEREEAAAKAAQTVSLSGDNLGPKTETPQPLETPKPESSEWNWEKIHAENQRIHAAEDREWKENTERWGKMIGDAVAYKGPSAEERLAAQRAAYKPAEPTDWLGTKNKGQGPLSPGEHQDPRIPGGYYVDENGKTSTIEQGRADAAAAEKRLGDERSRRGYRNQYREADSGKGESMSWKEYEGLDSRTRAAVDWNGLLQRARKSDRALVEKYDKNADNIVTLEEAGDAAKNTKGYSAAYERVFGKPLEGETQAYSPAIVGLLNQLDITDSGGDVRQYAKGFGGDAYINDEDLKAGLQYNGDTPVGPDGYTDARGEWVNRLASKMEAFNKRLADSSVKYNGVDVSVGLEGATTAQRDQFVQLGINGMQNEQLNYALAARLGDAEAPANGRDISFLGSQQQRARVGLMDQWLQGFYASEGYASGKFTTDNLQDKKWMKDGLKKYGLEWNEWEQFINSKLAGTTGSGDDLLR